MVFSSENHRMVDEYVRLRKVLKTITEECLHLLPKASFLECAGKLGMARGKVMVVNDPDAMPLLVEYCLYCFRMGGKTLVERYVEKTRPSPQSDEMAVCRAMMDSVFSVFQIRQVYKGRGVLLHDLFKENEVLLMDLGLGDTAVSETVLVGRILPLADFHMSAGTLLPLVEEPVVGAVYPILEKWRLQHPEMGLTRLSPGLEAAFSAQIIRAALKAGVLDNVRYSEVLE